MSLFPRSFITNDESSFPPIFRLLDEFNQYSRNNNRSIIAHTKSFTPKFDIKEHQSGYELHGELPGIDQKDVEIEFTDASTLTIKGRVEHSYTNETGGSKDSKDAKDSNQASNEKGQGKMWVRERSVGEFSRSFGFPSPVDQDSVKASMKNGVLSIQVPKAKKEETRRIKIS